VEICYADLFVVVGVLARLFALSALSILAESGGALAVIAAGIFAGVAIVSRGLERVLKLLEEIRDGPSQTAASANIERLRTDRIEVRAREIGAAAPSGVSPA
jgi:hypothetical protein